MEREQIFEQRRKTFEAIEAGYEKKYIFYSRLRVIIFILGVVFSVYFANERNGMAVAIMTAIFVLLFFLVLKRHNVVAYRRDLNRILKEINTNEALRMQLKLDAFDGGEEFRIKNHPYDIDLDIFGQNSIFQLINRADTFSGREKLAGYLNKKSSTTFIRVRQEAVQELAGDIDWRQEFEASGLFFKSQQINPSGLKAWLVDTPAMKMIERFSIFAWVMRMIMMVAIVAVIFGLIQWSWVFLPLLANIALLVRFAKQTQDVYTRTGKSFTILKSTAALIRKVETAPFRSSGWREFATEFSDNQKSASNEIGKLGRILEGFDARNGMMYHVLNPVFLLDLLWLFKAENWRMINGAHVGQWFNALGEIETICSIAGFAFAYPDFTYPEVTDKPHTLKAAALGHPLIPSDKRATNDFEFTVERQITLITGSNMSGKSTFLRTVGVNATLAMMGAPVCARQFAISIIDLFTSMRTQDNLVENVSSFYAELSRIRQLLDMLKGGEPAMFMLDELLKGTNSRDRHKGAIALIRQLAEMNASGFVSTHDLELSHLEEILPQVKNYSFESELEGDQLLFDYKIRRGAAESFNASILMAKIGIRMQE